MPFTLAQQKALAISPMVTAALSILGSGCIIRVVWKEKVRLRTTYHRLLFAISIMDMITSLAGGLSTLPIPKGTPGVWLAMGNVTTCTIQGFFTHLAGWIPPLNAALAIQYLLTSRYEWPEERIRKLEPFMIGLPIFLGVCTSIACVAMDLFNNANLWCWIAPFPQGCKDSFRYGNEANCTRGDNAFIYRYAFSYATNWISIIVATVCVVMVHQTVLQKEKEVDKFQENGVEVRTQSRRVFWQCLWYVVAFYVTWAPSTIVRIMQGIPQTKGKIFFPLVLLMAILLPLQGFWNFCVFTRARYRKYRRENPADTTWGAIKVAAFAITSSHHAKVTHQASSSNPDSSPPAVRTEAMLQSELTITQAEGYE